MKALWYNNAIGYMCKVEHSSGSFAEVEDANETSVFSHMPAFRYLVMPLDQQKPAFIAQQKWTGEVEQVGRVEHVKKYEWQPDLENTGLGLLDLEGALEIFTDNQNFSRERNPKNNEKQKKLLRSGLLENLAPSLAQVAKTIKSAEPGTEPFGELHIDDLPKTTEGGPVILFLRLGETVFRGYDRNGDQINMVSRSKLYMFDATHSELYQYKDDATTYSPDNNDEWTHIGNITTPANFISVGQAVGIDQA